MDYKNTLLLPKTDFPMRAELPKREPAFLAKWREEKIYDQIMTARAGKEKFVLHDGPPFANGDAHMGHALNMVLKDIVLKYQNMSGKLAPFVPGWDCHGLPIEHKVMKELGAAESDPIKIREKCEATARHFIGVQSEQFQRLGVFGDWANPYLTLDPAYEAETLRVFATLVEKSLVYQGLRPVLWSTGCQTALAEAEIEYQKRTDPAIFVKFPLSAESVQKFPELKDASLLIWTTTPWTLPANLAVAVSPRLDYALYDLVGTKVLCNTTYGQTLLSDQSWQTPGSASSPGGPCLIAGPWKGSDLVGLTYQHPFLSDQKTRRVFPAEFVTADAGTGLVHIAPGHGQDDYQLGMANGLEAFSPVDNRGCLTAEFLPTNADDEVKALVGQYVFKANVPIIEILRKRGYLYAHVEYTHDYPYCWRSKTPIVYRAVKQWFIKVEAFRQQALDEIEKVEWIPASGKNRIRGAVETRPDWCISRQRTWGIPLPVFYRENGDPILDPAIARKFADIVEKEGAGIWFARGADELAAALGLPAGLRKGNDTLDVWIDSGTSWAAVVGKRAELAPAPADLYLEGSDQHRGWFQSSLLTSVAATDQAPYRAVLTNGFVVDEERKKISKSEGKPVDLMTLVNKHGADVLRLWVSSQQYSNDMPFSDEIFNRVADTYRSIRNTLRILLGNLDDFELPRDAVDYEKLRETDLCFLTRYLNIEKAVESAYARYDYAQVYQLINRFCAVDLSAQYVDLLKDRLYCDAADSASRRSAQYVLNWILTGLLTLLAPILPYTAEEAWGFARRRGSVHLQTYSTFDVLTSISESLLFETGGLPRAEAAWAATFDLRTRVNEKLEEARRDKKIGKSLEACVEIHTKKKTYDLLSAHLLDEFFIVSKVVLKPTEGEDTITVTRAEEHGMKKCIRCWKYWDHVGANAEHPELCDRCTKVVLNWKP